MCVKHIICDSFRIQYIFGNHCEDNCFTSLYSTVSTHAKDEIFESFVCQVSIKKAFLTNPIPFSSIQFTIAMKLMCCMYNYEFKHSVASLGQYKNLHARVVFAEAACADNLG